MNRVLRKVLIAFALFFGVLVVGLIAFVLFFDVNRYKPQIEAAVNQSSGLNLKILGKASLVLFPRIRIALKEAHLSNQGKEIFKANEIQIAPRLISYLIHHEMIVDQISLLGPKISLEKNAQGKMNDETVKTKSSKPVRPGGSAAGQKESGMGPGQIHSIQVRDGDLTYIDRKSGQKMSAQGMNANLSDVAWGASGTHSQSGAELIKSIVFQGDFRAQSLKTGTFAASNLKTRFKAEQGIFTFNPTEAKIFGGTIRGNGQIDLRNPVPSLKLVQSASGIDLKQVFVQGKGRVSGIAEGAVNLSATGKTQRAITQTAVGTVSIHSRDITLTGVDIDGLAGQLKVAQSVDLAKIGSALMLGPLAPVLGQTSQTVSRASEKKSLIRNFVSNWQLNHGIAQTKDVALSTGKNIIAFQGRLNLVNQTYQNFDIATVDPKGCAKNQIEIAGALNQPHLVAGSIGKQLSKSALGSLGSEAGSAGSQVAGIFGGKPETEKEPSSPHKGTSSDCDVFYSGVVLKTR
jgi:hypothetical protein